jgi:ATP-dependent DNA helicase RecG
MVNFDKFVMMNKDILQGLIAQGEGFHLEFKEAINSSLNKEIVAFANAKGGKILIGVDDDGNIKRKAFDNGDRSKVQVVARECDPSIDIEMVTVEDEPNVLVIDVKEGLNKPYRCTGGFYMREGANSNKRKTNEIYGMFKGADRFSFDDSLCPKADFKTYFEPTTLKRFLKKAGKEQLLSDEDTLHNLGVVEFVDGQPVFNNTGVLFFVKEPEFFLSQAIIQCARYKGIIKLDIEDQKNMTSDIITNIDECFTFLRRSLDVAFKFESGNPNRIEVWEIPYVALKEALINSIAHRDYIERGTHIQVEVFDDRVSITNFGGLASGLSKEDLGKKSIHRNPNIVNLLHRTDFIEKMGTGLLRIDNALKDAGLPKAEFEISEHWFSIIFKRKNKESQIDIADTDNLTEQDLKVLNFCISEPRSRSSLFDFLKMSNETRNFKRHLSPLLERNLIKMTIPESPRSGNQKYVATKLGIKMLG